MRASRGFAQQKRGVPSRPLMFVTRRFRGTRGVREVWRGLGWGDAIWGLNRGCWSIWSRARV